MSAFGVGEYSLDAGVLCLFVIGEVLWGVRGRGRCLLRKISRDCDCARTVG